MNNYVRLTMSILAASMLAACGGGSGNSSPSKTTEVTVERGPVLGAKVFDAKGVVAKQKGNTNVYVFAGVPSYPVKSIGGYVDLDNDGKKSKGDLKMPANLKMASYTNVITPITSYLSTFAEKEEREKQIKKLKEEFNIKGNISKEVPSKISKEAVILSNAIFLAKIEENSTSKDIIKTKYDKVDDIVNKSHSSEKNTDKLALEIEKDIVSEHKDLAVGKDENNQNSSSNDNKAELIKADGYWKFTKEWLNGKTLYSLYHEDEKWHLVKSVFTMKNVTFTMDDNSTETMKYDVTEEGYFKLVFSDGTDYDKIISKNDNGFICLTAYNDKNNFRTDEERDKSYWYYKKSDALAKVQELNK